MRVEVRCCCDPGKLLGTVDACEPEGQRGRHWISHLEPDFTAISASDQFAPAEIVELEFATVVIGLQSRKRIYEALKSNHYPVETLRRIPGFKEAL